MVKYVLRSIKIRYAVTAKHILMDIDGQLRVKIPLRSVKIR